MLRRRQPPSLASLGFVLSLAGLAALALVPEIFIFVHNHEDSKKILPIVYYTTLVSFLLFTPAWWLPPLLSRLWVILVGTLTAVSTLIIGFQAISIGARWDLTAHSALMQTHTQQVLDFSRYFGSVATVLWLVLLAAGFIACIVFNVRVSRPTRRLALIWTVVGLLLSAYGLNNFFNYGRRLVRTVTTSEGVPLTIAGVGVNSHHPLIRLALTHHNYRITHNYYIEAYHQASLHRAELKGALPVAGATPPRILLVVIGESAGRRHWSLYGYPRETNPRLAALKDELLLFTDVISDCVGTQASLRRMLDTTAGSQPVFPLFSEAGYTTHWFSAKHDQGIFDVEIAALVQSCDERIFLNGAYDENLLPLVERVIATPGRHVIFLNLYGSHIRYKDRYPEDHAVFRGDGFKADTIATYDNTIRYTDFVLGRLIDLLRRDHSPSAFLYLSDHAEDVYDSTADRYLFRSDSIATNPMYEVPFAVWFSAEYRQANPAFIEATAAARTKKYQTPGLYHSLIDLARLTHPILDETRSLFSPAYVERDRHVGNGDRPYEKSAH